MQPIEHDDGRARLSERAAGGRRVFLWSIAPIVTTALNLVQRTARSDGPYHEPQFPTADAAYAPFAQDRLQTCPTLRTARRLQPET